MSDHVDLVAVMVAAEPVIKQRYERMLSSISHRFDTDDLFQVTCQRAYRSIKRCNGTTPAEIHNWLMKIAANACRTAITAHKVSKVRSTKVEKISIGAASSEETTLDPSDQGTDLAASAAVKEQCQHMLACIDRLPKQRQAVLKLRYLESKSYAEIAAILDITETAARTSVSQALADARAEVGQYSLPGFD